MHRVFILFILSLVSVNAHASYKFYYNASTDPNVYFDSSQLACDAWFNLYTRNGQHLEITGSSVQNETTLNRWTTDIYCKSIQDGGGYVYAQQNLTAMYFEPSCPSAGSIAYLTGQLDSIPVSPVNYDGCEYDWLVGEQDCAVSSTDGLTYCTFAYSSTGDESILAPYAGASSSESFSPVAGTKDSTQSSADTTLTDNGTVTNPDSSTTSSTTEVTTQVKDSGTVINEDTQQFTVKSSDGTETTYTKTTTTTQNTDGTFSETISYDQSYRTPNTTTTTIKKSDGTITSISTTSQTTTSNTTTNSSYDDQGTQVSSNSVTTGATNPTGGTDVDGDGANDLPAFCEYAKTVCDMYTWFTDTDDNLYGDETVPDKVIDGTEYAVDYQSGVTSGSGSCPPPITFTINMPVSKTFTIELDDICQLAIDIKPFVLMSAYLTAGFIFVSLFRR